MFRGIKDMPEDLVKVDRIPRVIELKREAGYIIIEPARSVYLLVRSEIVKKLLSEHNINLQERDKDKKPLVTCELALEGTQPKLIFSVFNHSGSKKEEITEMR